MSARNVNVRGGSGEVTNGNEEQIMENQQNESKEILVKKNQLNHVPGFCEEFVGSRIGYLAKIC